MSSKIKYIILVITAFILIGCKDAEITKMVNKTYIDKNNGIVFDNYAIALDEENNDGKTYAIFEKVNSDRYKKLYSMDSYSSKDRILCTDEVIYLFGYEGGITGYKLNSKQYKKIEITFEEIDGLIHIPVEVFGFLDGKIYVSYYNNDKDGNILYAEIDEDLDSYDSIEYSELPESYEYVLVRK